MTTTEEKFKTIEEKIQWYEEKIKNEVYLYVPWSIVNGKKISIDMLMYGIIKFFVKDRYKSIVDPTCGRKNYQFSKIVDILEYWGIEYHACDKDPNNWSGKVCDVFKPETLPEGEVWIYDPPYMPIAKADIRNADYGLNINRTVEGIRRFYSKQVFENFMLKGAKLIVVKGGDIYYPTTSDNLYLFLRDIIHIPKTLKPISIIIYRYFSNNNRLNNWMIWRSMQKRKFTRVHNVHSYYLLLKRKK